MLWHLEQGLLDEIKHRTPKINTVFETKFSESCAENVFQVLQHKQTYQLLQELP